MDSLTHIALGACVGELLLGKKAGKKAILIGAVAQSFPDIDFIANFWTTPSGALLAHRGITHSILFAALSSTVFALLLSRIQSLRGIKPQTWWLFCFFQLALHLLIDCLNVYGTGLLEPFSNTRFSVNMLYVLDPFFSISLWLALPALLILRQTAARRKTIAGIALAWGFIYLIHCSINKWKINRDTIAILSTQPFTTKRYFTTPTPLNNWLWMLVAESDSGYHIAYKSVFVPSGKNRFEFVAKRKNLLDSVADKTTRNLIRFSRDFYTLSQEGDSLVFNDIRFGQVAGWMGPGARFTFRYYLHPAADNTMVMQTGRIKGWSRKNINGLIEKIRGVEYNQPLR